MIHDISLGEERERDIKFINLFVSKAQGPDVEQGQKTSMWGPHSLPAHFVAVRVAHADT